MVIVHCYGLGLVLGDSIRVQMTIVLRGQFMQVVYCMSKLQVLESSNLSNQFIVV